MLGFLSVLLSFKPTPQRVPSQKTHPHKRTSSTCALNVEFGPFQDIWYKDQHGHEDKEYISLFADNVTIAGRTPLIEGKARGTSQKFGFSFGFPAHFMVVEECSFWMHFLSVAKRVP